MSKLLDISIHGTQRVAIVEQLVHLCRYDPGLVILEGDAGRSPVNFLRDMAKLLRDEMDFALLDGVCTDVQGITSELIDQWFVFNVGDQEQSEIQSVHHYLDISLQSGRLALVVIERSSLLTDAAAKFLVGLMARHSRLTVLFAGIVDAHPLLRMAQQAEVPVHRIDLPDAPLGGAVASVQLAAEPSVSLTRSQFDHRFSDDSYEAPEPDVDDDNDFCASVDEARSSLVRREPVMDARHSLTQSFARVDSADSILAHDGLRSGARNQARAAQNLGRGKKDSRLFLVLGCIILSVLLVLMVENIKRSEDGKNTFSLDSLPEPVSPSAATNPASEPSLAIVPAPSRAVSEVVAPVEAFDVAPQQPSGVRQIEAQPSSVSLDAAAPSDPPRKDESQLPVEHGAPARNTSSAVPSAKSAKAKAVPMTEKQWRANPDHYTVQIAAAHSESNIKRLAGSLPAQHSYFIRRTSRGGKPWFVLIYGSFVTKEAAVAAKEALPFSGKSVSSPWVRKQGEVFTL